MHTDSPPTYIGRFAPSPTGPLHFGSLLAAVASYLDARAHQGSWLVRVEDIDPPREVPGATAQILRILEHYGLEWDGEVRYQSQRLAHYQEVIDELLERERAYYCSCSRQEIAQRGAIYDGYCRGSLSAAGEPAAIRLQVPPIDVRFQDRIQGMQEQHLSLEVGDFVIRRKDLLYAYQLAVVVDDAEQGVTHVVRGSDLLDSTPRQIYLQQRLDYPQPHYAHIPVLTNEAGQKLSKQTFAKALPEEQPGQQLHKALKTLGQQPPLELIQAPPAEILNWAQQHWSLERIPRCLNLNINDLNL